MASELLQGKKTYALTPKRLEHIKQIGFKKGHLTFKGAEKGWFKKGNPSPYKGMKSRYGEKTIKKMSISALSKPPITEETRKKLKECHKGEKSYLWKGGVTPYFRLIRQARLKNAGGSHTKQEWKTLLAQYNWTCPCCIKSDVKLTKDHIIPVMKGGSDNIENIQPLCQSCNSKKMLKVIKYDLIVKEKIYV